MKTLLALFSLLTLNSIAGDGIESKSDFQRYEITYQKMDESLPSGQSLIEFTFKEHSGICLRDKVFTSHNKNRKVFQPKMDTNGVCFHKIKPGKYKFKFWTSFTDTLVTDEIEIKDRHAIAILVHLHSKEVIIEADKPVIYLYPSANTQVSVELNFKGDVGFTYPKLIENKWNVKAYADGTLEANGKQFNYLFWDGKITANLLKPDTKIGSVIESANLVDFFETSLEKIGLNTKESTDFITYWVPRMMKNEKNYVQFILTEDYAKIATLNVVPKPDKQLRVYMVWSNAENENSISPTPQTFPEFTRGNFTLVEWGGSEIPNLMDNL